MEIFGFLSLCAIMPIMLKMYECLQCSFGLFYCPLDCFTLALLLGTRRFLSKLTMTRMVSSLVWRSRMCSCKPASLRISLLTFGTFAICARRANWTQSSLPWQCILCSKNKLEKILLLSWHQTWCLPPWGQRWKCSCLCTWPPISLLTGRGCDRPGRRQQQKCLPESWAGGYGQGDTGASAGEDGTGERGAGAGVHNLCQEYRNSQFTGNTN